MSIIRLRWSLLLCVSIITVSALAGCRRSNTVSMAGQITLDGVALPTGTIVLIPMAKDSGPSVGCAIVDGRYAIPADRGPWRGVKYRIEIRSIDPASGSTKNPLSRGRPVFEDRVPPMYNSESQLELAVPEDSSGIQKDFQLQGKKKIGANASPMSSHRRNGDRA
jgi:hypothetical protein